MFALFNVVIGILAIISSIHAQGCPSPSLDEAKKIDTALANFAINFYKNVSSTASDKNLILSPASVALALALLENGANGTTREEIKNVLIKTGSNIDVLASYSSLARQLQINQGNTKLTVANGMFINKSMKLNSDYETTVKNCFQGKAENVDFKTQLEESRQNINKWVSDQTSNKIPELFKSGSLTQDVLLVLANAIYFKGNWKTPFIQSKTKPGKFYKFGKEQDTQQIPFMQNQADFGYAKTGNLEILEMAYDNQDLSMYILLPKAKDGLASAEQGLNGEQLKTILSQVAPTRVILKVPKFALRSGIDLGTVLPKMGMGKMFDDADFGRMADQPIKVSKAVHEAYINVDEKGTEAAAATGFAMVPRSGMRTEITLTVDHPFLYAIVHKPTGAIVFLGKVNFIEQQ